MSLVTTSAKGQIVIPKEIRDKLGILPGGKVSLRLVSDHIEIHPLPADPIKALRGIFKDYPGSLAQELLEERRRDDEIDEKSPF